MFLIDMLNNIGLNGTNAFGLFSFLDVILKLWCLKSPKLVIQALVTVSMSMSVVLASLFFYSVRNNLLAIYST